LACFDDDARFCPSDQTALVELPVNATEPKQLGAYRLDRKLAEDALGSIYRAHRKRQSYTLRLVAPQLCLDVKKVEQLLEEQRQLKTVSHPALVRVNMAKREDDGTVWLVQELVEGSSLRDELERRSRFSVEEAVVCTRLILRGLSALHELGMVHGLLTPERIFVERGPNGRRQLRLCEPGLYSLLATERPEDVAVDHPALYEDIAEYLSPEAIRGEPIGPSSDVFVAAVLLYEMIAGQAPFSGANPATLFKRQLGENPLPLAMAAEVELPDGLQDILGIALGKRADERFQSATALMGALGAVCELRPEEAEDYLPDDVLPLPELPLQASESADSSAKGGKRRKHGKNVDKAPAPDEEQASTLPSVAEPAPEEPSAPEQGETKAEAPAEPELDQPEQGAEEEPVASSAAASEPSGEALVSESDAEGRAPAPEQVTTTEHRLGVDRKQGATDPQLSLDEINRAELTTEPSGRMKNSGEQAKRPMDKKSKSKLAAAKASTAEKGAQPSSSKTGEAAKKDRGKGKKDVDSQDLPALDLSQPEHGFEEGWFSSKSVDDLPPASFDYEAEQHARRSSRVLTVVIVALVVIVAAGFVYWTSAPHEEQAEDPAKVQEAARKADRLKQAKARFESALNLELFDGPDSAHFALMDLRPLLDDQEYAEYRQRFITTAQRIVDELDARSPELDKLKDRYALIETRRRLRTGVLGLDLGLIGMRHLRQAAVPVPFQGQVEFLAPSTPFALRYGFQRSAFNGEALGGAHTLPDGKQMRAIRDDFLTASVIFGRMAEFSKDETERAELAARAQQAAASAEQVSARLLVMGVEKAEPDSPQAVTAQLGTPKVASTAVADVVPSDASEQDAELEAESGGAEVVEEIGADTVDESAPEESAALVDLAVATESSPDPVEKTPEPVEKTPVEKTPEPVEKTPVEKTPTPTEKAPSAHSLVNDGLKLIDAGDLEGARANFDAALKAQPNNDRAFYGIGRIYWQQKDFQKAAEYYGKAAKHAPKEASYWVNLGNAFIKLQRYQDALEAYEQAHQVARDEKTRDSAQKGIDLAKRKLGQ
jgi:serine/threonine-protein kinase